jgi:hypothetical protein
MSQITLPTNYLELLAWFAGGLTLANAIPHFVSGVMGRRFPSPFAKPPGKGQSSAVTNVLWGFFNLALAYLLLCRVGAFDLHNCWDVGAFALGVLLIGVFCARHFGSLNDGRGPGLA